MLCINVCVRVCVAVRLEPVQQLVVDTESESSVRVRWRGVAGARLYRLVWGPFTGNGATNTGEKQTTAPTLARQSPLQQLALIG